MSSAVFVQTNGLGFLFHSLIHLRMSVFEFGDAAVGGAAELAVGQLGEPALDQVEPAESWSG